MFSEIINQNLEQLIRKIDMLIAAQKRTPGEESEWVTKEEAMRMLCCSERTLQTLRDNSSLPYSKPFGGSKIFYRRRDIIKLLESGYTGKKTS
jgi:hypothetical protein